MSDHLIAQARVCYHGGASPQNGHWWAASTCPPEPVDQAEARRRAHIADDIRQAMQYGRECSADHIALFESFATSSGSSPEAEGCEGHACCTARVHVHGCFADTEGRCDQPAHHEAEQEPRDVGAS